MFTKRLRDLFVHQRNFWTRDIELLKHGRHFRMNDASKIIVGRNSFENEALQRLSTGEDILIQMAQFPGPTVLVPSQSDDTTARYAASLCALYSDAPKDEEVVVMCRKGDSSQTIRIKAAQREDAERRMI
jgi:predicted ribosome quality control (RQC) complex YloA/Tae2 family protein